MNQPLLDLPKLIDFLLCLLRSTDRVKSILNSHCDEAKFVLTPWPLETITRRRIDEESCTCTGNLPSDEHVNEIASGIDKAIAQARQLREKLALNVLEEKKIARRPNVSQIYAPAFGGSKSKTRVTESKIGKENSGGDGILDKPSDEKKRQNVIARRQGVLRMGEKNRGTSIKENSDSKKNSAMKIQPGDSNISDRKGKSIAERASSSERDKKSIVEKRRSGYNGIKITEGKRIADKKLIATSPYNCLAAASGANHKSKTKKNFIAANKSSIKNIKAASSSTSTIPSVTKDMSRKPIRDTKNSTTRKSSDSLTSGATSSAELDKLISKISMESMENKPSNSDMNLGKNGCPVHDLSAQKYVEEKIYTTVDVAEGLDLFGVPSDLVKVLKVYHGYLNSRSTTKSTNKRSEKAAHKFLSEFHIMYTRKENTTKRNKLENLCKDFLSVFKESCNKKVDFIELSKLRIRYTDLDSACKYLEIRSVSPTKRKMSKMIENRSDKNFLREIRAWRSNAVWNEASIPSLQSSEAISNACCIRYSNRHQLQRLFDLIQRIQQSKYRADLIDLLTSEAIPWVQNTLEPTSEDYINAYKTISIISNLLNLSVPVLVRTDK